MSTTVPIEAIVAVFSDERAAENALEQLQWARQSGLITIHEAAILRRDKRNKLHIEDISDQGVGRGAVIGGVIGGLIGIITGPIGMVTAAGAIVGALASRLRDAGFSDRDLRALGASLIPGTSAIITVVEYTWMEKTQQLFRQYGAQVMTQAVQADVVSELEAQKISLPLPETLTTQGITANQPASTAQPGQAPVPPQEQQPAGTGEVSQPTSTTQAEQPSTPAQKQPGGTSEGSQPTTSVQEQQPTSTTQTEQPSAPPQEQ